MEKINAMASKADVLDATMKFVIGDNSYFLDGTGDENVVRMSDAAADCTVTISEENFQKLINRKLNPMTAVMMGKIKIKGKVELAMKLKDLMS